jgi:8-oxo-dGTP diphosphatase
LANILTFLPVVAAAIQDEAGRLLLQQRVAGKIHEGCWEFPGGKVESDESPRVALVREIGEELALDIDPLAMEPVGFSEESSGSGWLHIVLLLYTCPTWRGDPRGCDGQNWGWFTIEEAARLPLPPMDRALLMQFDRAPPG